MAVGEVPAPANGGSLAIVERGRATQFKPGPDPRRSAGTISSYERSVRGAIQRQETPERICEVVDAMRSAALQGDAKAAAVYLKTVGAEVTDSERISRAVVALFEAKLAEARDRVAIEVTADAVK